MKTRNLRPGRTVRSVGGAAAMLVGGWMLSSCASGPYPAPANAEIGAAIDSVTVSGWGPVFMVEAFVKVSTDDGNTQLLPDTLVTATSVDANYVVFLPETAIGALDNSDMSCAPGDVCACPDADGDGVDECTESGAAYYDWTDYYNTGGDGNEVFPNFVRATTDATGIARFYAWVYGAPLTYEEEECEYTYWSVGYDELVASGDLDPLPAACKIRGGDIELNFSISYASAQVTVTYQSE